MAQLCESFYRLGWAAGTGGGISIRIANDDGIGWRVFSTPSGLQKEDIIGSDIFEFDQDQNIVIPPKTPNLRPSACTPLWYVVYKHRPHVKCVIHTHSMNAQMATLLDPTEQSETLDITHLEMLKGVGNHAYDDILQVPIIDNRPSEELLADQMERVLLKYPKANAVLVRRHGLFVWGDSWEQAKTHCESFDCLFESAVRMKSMGLDPGVVPSHGKFREGTTTKRLREEEKQNVQHATETTKKPKIIIEGNGFNNASDSDNRKDMELTQTTIPMLPRHSKILLLDIEGCTTSISSVKDEMFSYILQHIHPYVEKMNMDDVKSLVASLESDLDGVKDEKMKKDCMEALSNEGVVACVRTMVRYDIKASGLKTLQGHMWDYGFKSGVLKGHVYKDFLPMLQWCVANQISAHIYSSGSVKAQKLLFGHSLEGDLTSFITSHFDTVNAGNKKDASSYSNIALAMGVDPKEICFVSDAEAELVAAREAGIGHVVMSVRPGNASLTAVGREFPIVHSLLQLCGE
jgi:methylthioribulose 1-phosphate dehydratase/enolase-phosphatase E1